MNKLTKRILTGLLGGGITIAAIVWTQWGLMLLGMLVSLGALWELLQMLKTERRYAWSSLAFGVLIWAMVLGQSLSENFEWKWIWILFIPAFLVLLFLALFDSKSKNTFQNIAYPVLGLAYCVPPLLMMYSLAFPEGVYQWRIPIGLLTLGWTLDVGAYFSGKFLGKHKLFPRISPNKTWEGSIGGGLLCVVLSVAFSQIPEMQNSANFNWIIVGILIAIFGQYGDLIESMFKRSAAVKDSGNILPGHGGMLDRFDGFLLSLPLIWLYVEIGF